MADRDAIDKLAEAIADGKTVDWAAAESSAPEADRTVVSRLRRIGQLANRRGHPGGPPPVPNPPTEDPSTRHWGHLSIAEKVGEGAFGEVYRAHDPKLERDVALKLLRESESTRNAGTTVIEEGRLLARVRHPNVATVYGADRLDGYVGIWMEFIDGKTLEQTLHERARLDANEAARIGVDLCRALAAVHQAGVVHRDIKPQNVMQDVDGRLVLMDFGTGRQREPVEGAVEALTGTPLYLAPEALVEGDPATVRSDIYSLGVLLYHLVTNSYPVAANARTVREVQEAHRAGARTPLGDARPDLPAAFVEVIERAISADPQLRYASADEMEAALSDTIAEPRFGRIGRWASSHPIGAAAAIFLTLGLAAAGVWRWQHPPLAPIPLGQRRLVLVATFEDLTPDGGTDRSWLGRAVSRRLEDELVNSRIVSVVSRDRAEHALQLMDRDRATTIGGATAREIAERDGGIPVYVAGAVAPKDSGWLVTANVVNPKGVQVIAKPQETVASTNELGPAIRRLANQVREAVGESHADVVRSNNDISKVHVPPLQAFDLYSEALVRGDNPDWRKALNLLDRALALDGDFAVAHMWRAWTLSNLHRRPEEWQPEIARAITLKDTAAPWEQSWIDGVDALLTHDSDRVPTAFAALLDLNPAHDWTALTMLDRLSEPSHLPPREALPLVWTIADVRPYDLRAVDLALRSAMKIVDVARARQNAERLRAIVSDAWDDSGHLAWTVDAWEAWVQGDMKEATRRIDAVAKSLGGRSDPARSAVAVDVSRFYLALGRTRDAEQAATFVTNLQTRAFTLALAAYWREDDAALRKSLPKVLALAPPDYDNWQNSEIWTLLLLKAERREDAARLIEARSRPPQADVLRARLLAYDRKTADALDRVKESSDKPIASPFYIYDRQDLLATLLWNQGQKDDAVQRLRYLGWRKDDDHNEYWPAYFSAPTGIRNLVTLMEFARQSGKSKEADAIQADLQKLFSNAEPDFPSAQTIVKTASK